MSLLANVKQKIPRSGFTRNLLILMTGTGIAQVIPIIISPILTRLYTPVDFGVSALYMSVVSLFAVIATGRFELAIMLPEKKEDAVNLFALSTLISIFLSLLILIIIILFNHDITQLLGNTEISKWLYLIPLSVLCAGISQALNYWANRNKQYHKMASSKITQSISTAGINLAMGFSGMPINGIIGGTIIGKILSTFVLGLQVWRDDKEQKKFITMEKIIENTKKYRDFPKINTLHSFVDLLQLNGITFLISSYYGYTELGFYSFSLLAISTPLGLISSTLSQVLFQKAIETKANGGNLQKLVKTIFCKLTLISIPMAIICIFLAPEIFVMIFGSVWRESGIYTQILTPWLFLNFICSSLMQIPVILNRQKTSFYLSLIYNIGNLVVVYFSILFYRNIFKSLAVLSIFASLVTLCIGYWIYQISNEKYIRFEQDFKVGESK